MNAVRIERAKPQDLARLTGIAFAAKRHWGYPEAWIQRWSEGLTITRDYIATNPTFVARVAGAGDIAGFSALRFEGTEPWLDHVWVLPSAMGQGIGRKLFDACETEARRAGALRLNIEADPNAESFYERMGARTIGRRDAAMDGAARFLPLMEKLLPPQPSLTAAARSRPT